VKLLLDECIIQDFRLHLTGHDVFTVGYMKWAGTKNGALMRRAADAQFEALITTDRGIQHQHNLDRLPLAVVYMDVPDRSLEELLKLLPALETTLARLTPRTFYGVGPVTT